MLPSAPQIRYQLLWSVPKTHRADSVDTGRPWPWLSQSSSLLWGESLACSGPPRLCSDLPGTSLERLWGLSLQRAGPSRAAGGPVLPECSRLRA